MRKQVGKCIVLILVLTLAFTWTLPAQADIKQAKDRAYKMVGTFRTLGYSFRETGRYGALERGNFHTFSTTLFQGSSYVFVAGGDKAAINVDLKVYDENGALVAKDDTVQPAATTRVTPLWSGTFYVRVTMADSSMISDWYLLQGQAPAPKLKPAPPKSPVEAYFRPRWVAPGSASEIEAHFRSVYASPPEEFVLDRYGRSRYSAVAVIYFDTDSDRIRPESLPLLDEWGAALRGGLARGVFMVEGHTDSTGTAQHNLTLSQRRARAVVDYLVGKWGISPARLIPRGFGKNFPASTNLTAAGRASNRRVQFTLVDWID